MGNSSNRAGGLLMNDKTIVYYDENAEDFIASTINADMSEQYDLFLQHIPNGGYILDLGCGSGRDSKHFLDRGYTVEAVDGSPVICEKASLYIGQSVRLLMFQDLDYSHCFDAVWASASLLHISKDALMSTMSKISKSLKPNGILYVSFKHGDFEGERNGRFFSDFTEDVIVRILSKPKIFSLVDMQITSDVRVGRDDEKWLNLILRKITE
jgi:SAM-dependent methyltransferase